MAGKVALIYKPHHHHLTPSSTREWGSEAGETQRDLMYFSVSEGGRRQSVPIAQVADLAPGLLNKGSYFQRGAGEAGRLCLRGQVGGQVKKW